MNDLSTYVIALTGPVISSGGPISRRVTVKDRKEAIKHAKMFYGNRKVSIIKIGKGIV
tara:strand:- start:3644 stop:3817 length:174 start_codon:yes stop_codon:yes gene_type:complete